MNKRTLQSRAKALRQAVAFALLGMAACASGAWAANSAINIIQDNFTGAQAQNNWDALGNACLTAGNGTGSIPACTTVKDPVGSGALRLTDANTFLHGAIVSHWTFPSNQGIQVTFTTYVYGGDGGGAYDGADTGADGIGFYLLDSAVAPNLGSFGGSLGYSCSNANAPYDGMLGAYIGLGLDEYGNFLNPGDNTATGAGQHPNEVGIRGNGNVNWAWLTQHYPQYYPSYLATTPGWYWWSSATTNTPPTMAQDAVEETCASGDLMDFSNVDPNSSDPANYDTGIPVPDYKQLFATYMPAGKPMSNESASTRSQATPITYKLIITSNGLLSLSYEYGSSTTFDPLITKQDISANNGPMPPAFRFGFGASTGGSTNVHEITCFSVMPANQNEGAPVAPLSVGSGSLIYSLTSGLDPIAGHAYAYTVDASGNPATNPTWDAGSLMTASKRTSALYSTGADNASVVPFANLDAAAFNVALSNQSQSVTTPGTSYSDLNALNASDYPSIQSSSSAYGPNASAANNGLNATCKNRHLYKWVWNSKTKKGYWSKQPTTYSCTSSSTSTKTVLAPTNTCLGTTVAQADQNIIGFTKDPNYTWSGMPASCPSYLGARQAGWTLGEVSQGDDSHLLEPSSNPLFLTLPGYVSYTQSVSNRSTALLFTDNDGFLYSVGAHAGTLKWGWMPRNLAANLQNYTSTPNSNMLDGKFVITDAVDASGNWATYVVGSAQSGASWYDLKLGDVGNPPVATPVANIALPAMASGSTYPQRQAPAIGLVYNYNASTKTSTPQVEGAFVTNTGSGSSTTSTLTEFDVATGASSQAAIPSKSIASGGVTSNLYYDSNSGQLFFGDSAGNVYVMPLTGNASTDVGNITQFEQTKDQLPVVSVAYQMVSGKAYVWASSKTGLTVFGIGSGGWTPFWATDSSGGYLYTSGAWTSTSSISALQPTAIITDVPVIVNGSMVVPVYLPPSGSSATCNTTGNAYYDFYSLVTGKFPTNQIKDSSGNYVTGPLFVGRGEAYSPTVTVTKNGVPVYSGSQQQGSPTAPVTFNKSGMNTYVQWREH